MATLQGKAVKNTYRQVLQIGANNVGVSGTLQRVQDGAGVNTALSLSTVAATVHGDLTITGDLIITGGGIQIQDLIDDTVATLIQNGTGITWTYNDGARTLTGNFTGTTSVVPEGSNLYYTQGRFDSAFAAKSTTNLAEGANLYFTEARGNANFATNFATKTTTNLPEGSNLYFTNARARTALSVTGGTGLSYDNTTGVFNLAAIPNASLSNSSITINGQSVSLGGTVTLTTTNIGEGTNLYFTEARGNANFATNLAASSTTNLAEGTNLYYTQARFDTAFSNKSTTNLAEGANLYYTQARFNSALAAKSTTDLAEGSNLYYTDTRARLALSSSATGLSYANNSGVFSLTAGYAIPTTAKLGQYDTAYNRSIVSAAVTGTGTKTLSITQQDANVVSATWTDLGITTINGTANQITATTVANTTTLAFTNDVTMPNNLVVSGNLTINGTATYVNTQSISAKDPLFEVANDNNTTDAVDIGYYGRYYDTPQTRVEFTGLFRDASDAGKFKFFTGLVDEPTNVVNTTGTGYTVGTLVANFEGNLAGTANAANALSTARTIAASGDAVWSVSFDGSANVTSALTLANTGVTATTYGTSTSVPTIAVDGKGRITSASNTNITFPVTSVNGAAGTVVLTTTNIAEGTNQYFTTARAQAAITGGASSVVTSDLTASRALVSDGSGKIAASATTTTTEIGYLAGVTSALQTQLDGKLNLTGGTLSGGLSGTTGTFSGILTTPQVKAATSAGLSINANSGTQVADFGAGGSANITFFGGLSGTSATFSSTLGVTGALSGTSATFSSTFRVGTTSTPSSSAIIAVINQSANAGGLQLTSANNGGVAFIPSVGGGLATYLHTGAVGSETYTLVSSIASTGAATFSSSVTAQTGEFLSGGQDGATGSVVRIGTTSTNANARNWGIVNTWDNFGDLTFRVSNAQGGNALSAGATRMVILSSGNVGIGTSSPACRLDILGSNEVMNISGTNASSAYTGYYYNTSTLVGYIGNGSSILSGAASSDFIFRSQGALVYATNGNNERMRITSGGDVLIGTTTDVGSKLHVTGNIVASGTGSVNGILSRDNNNSTTYGFVNNGSGSLTLTNSGVANVGNFNMTTGVYVASSDINKKKDFEASTIGLYEVLQLKPTMYRFKTEDEIAAKQLGFIAQEVQLIIPEAYVESGEEDDKFIGLNFNPIVAALVKAIQEQTQIIKDLEARIKDLEAK